MKNLRKNIRLAWVLLALFSMQLFAPVAIAANSYDRHSNTGEGHFDGIVICTTTGLKLLTPAGDLVPIGDQDTNAVSEHCFACFTASFIGIAPSVDVPNFERNFIHLTEQTIAYTFHSQWKLYAFSARAPPLAPSFV